MPPIVKVKRAFGNRKNVNFIGNFIYLIAIVWIIAVGIGIIESVTYRGFFLKHTSINPIILYVFLGFIELLGSFFLKGKKNKFFKYFQRTNFFLSLLLFFLYISFSFIERITYDNFIFSHFHVDIGALLYPLILTIYTNFVLMDLKYLVLAILGLILSLGLKNNLSDIWVKNRESVLYVFKNPNASYKEKMENALGKQFYDYVLFVKENTPEHSKILLPPFPAYPWPQSGNPVYMRYFLYPRTLLNGKEYSQNYDLNTEAIDYVLVDWGETAATSDGYTHGWPKFDIKTEKIIYWTVDGKIMTKAGNYIYNEVRGRELWGLIMVKK